MRPPRKHRPRKKEEVMEEVDERSQWRLRLTNQQTGQEQTEEPLKDGSDICQQLMDRYRKSSAPQHHHLVATAAATRAILAAECLPLTPPSYFAAAMSAIETASSVQTLDSAEITALMSFLVIVLPAVPPGGITPLKAREAVEVLAELLERQEEQLAVSSVRSAVKCLGILLVFCDLEDWKSVKLGFETLLKFSVDKRPKVRRCAQECLEKAFKCLKGSIVVKKASKLVLSLFQNCISSADWSTTSPMDGCPDNVALKSENTEFLHMLNVLKSICPCLSVKVSSKVFDEVYKLMSPKFSALTRHILLLIGAFFETMVGDFILETESIVASLASYVAEKGNPMDTVVSAAKLLVIALNKLHSGGSDSWITNLPVVCSALAGLLASESDAAFQASNMLKDLINHHIDQKNLSGEIQQCEDECQENLEAIAVRKTCAALETTLIACGDIPNQHVLSVVSLLYLKLGKRSHIYMNGILLKLAHAMTLDGKDPSTPEHLRRCIGSAVVAIGPERMLSLLPVSLHSDGFSCTNIWLVPILQDYIMGSSLAYYMDDIMPLAKSFQHACCKVSNSLRREELLGHANDLLKLLPAFCRSPTDTNKQFGRLAELLIDFLKKDSSMHDSVALAIKILVNQNRSSLGTKTDAEESGVFNVQEPELDYQKLSSYSNKTATRNIKALSSSSRELLQIFSDLFVRSIPGTRPYMKDAIGCLASITDSSVTKEIFVSLLKRFGNLTGRDEFERERGDTDASLEKEPGIRGATEKDPKRCLLMDLASSLVEGAEKDLIDLIFSFVKDAFEEENNDNCLSEAYHALSRILEEHPWFCSSQCLQLIDLLVGLKPPSDTASLRNRFACFHLLMVHALKVNSEGENEEEDAKAFLILNEIILTLKDAREETRKEAYDILLRTGSSLRSISAGSFVAPFHKLIKMIMGYLSGSSPQIKSAAVSALSVLVYKDTDICFSIPDLIPSLLSLLESKAVEVIKAVLGFVKVLVSCLKTEDLQKLLSEVVDAVIRWSSLSRHHFRSKVTVIMEILLRKCGSAAVEAVTSEKYKGFLKTVMENRQNKTSKGASVPEEAASAGLHTPGASKRKNEELGGDGGSKDSRRDGDNSKKKRFKIRSNETGKEEKRNFHQLGGTRKRKLGQKNSGRKVEEATVTTQHKASKLWNNRKPGWKRQKK